MAPGRGADDPLDELAGAVRLACGRLGWSAAFAIIAGLLVLVPSWYMLEVYDRVLNSRNHFTLVMLTLLVLAAHAVMEVLEWAHAETARGMGVVFDAALGERVVMASFRAGLQGLAGGGLQPLNDLRTVREFFTSPLVRAALELPVALALLLVIFLLSPVLGWAAVGGTLVLAAVAWLNERRTGGLLRDAGRRTAAVQEFADGALRHAVAMGAMGMMEPLRRRWAAAQAQALDALGAASERAGGFSAFSRFLQVVLGSLMLGLGAWLVLRDALPGGPGVMILASILGGRVLRPLVLGVTHWRSGVAARAAWQRLRALLAAVPAAPRRFPLPAPRGLLTGEALVAAPPGGGATVLRGVTLGLNPGEVLVVIGASGSGKSSLARVLVGLWASTGGKARLDGVDVFSWDRDELAPFIGYLPQDVDLVEGSVADNIARFGDASPDEVVAAARAAGVHDLVEALPAGYGTQVGVDGSWLSAGQRQRVALARALFGRPVLVVLDEPNSNLDEAGDAALEAAIAAAKARGTTFVVVTHRSPLLRLADKILLLHEGVTRAYGPRDQVLEAMQKARAGVATAPAGEGA